MDSKGRTIRKVMGVGGNKKKIMQGKTCEKKIHAQDGPHFGILKTRIVILLEKCFKMHQMALERAQIFKIFPGEDAPGLPYGMGLPPILTRQG